MLLVWVHTKTRLHSEYQKTSSDLLGLVGLGGDSLIACVCVCVQQCNVYVCVWACMMCQYVYVTVYVFVWVCACMCGMLVVYLFIFKTCRQQMSWSCSCIYMYYVFNMIVACDLPVNLCVWNIVILMFVLYSDPTISWIPTSPPPWNVDMW